VLLLGLVPVVGPFLSLLWGARAVAFQMTDPALTRRGLSFAEKRRWHRGWRAESLGFGLAGMVGLLVPLANLLLGPALVAGGTLLVLSLEELGEPAVPADSPAPAPGP
jgi:CysZ protein